MHINKSCKCNESYLQIIHNDMIREIINFTENLIADIPDIMQWNIEPSQGIHIIIELDNEGHWINRDKNCFCTNTDKDIIPFATLVQYEQAGSRVGTTMNKVLDKKKQIFSCSPFILSFKKKSLSNEKLEGLGIGKIIKLLSDYFANAQNTCLLGDERLIQLSKAFQQQCSEVLIYLQSKTIIQNIKGENVEVKIFDLIKDDEYINLYLKNATIEEYHSAHNVYLQDKLFNCNDYNKEIGGEIMGLSNFLNGLNSKKPFLEHKTFLNNINGRISTREANLLSDFEFLVNNRILPNPLPIVIDNKEANKSIIKIFNEDSDPISYREVLNRLFARNNIKNLSNYYLINYSKRKSIVLNDVDFVPLFRFTFDKPLTIFNVFQCGIIRNKVFEPDSSIRIANIFDFERIVIKSIFNNSLVKIKDDKYSVNYFGDIDPTYVSGGDIMYLLILKYRKAIYDYIYKSKTNSINGFMFNDMMFQSILSNIQKDDVSGRFSWNNTIKEKLNIWFSLYNLFNNNIKQEEDMASKVTELVSKMSAVAKGESHFENPEEFAFGAGQIVSYLIDRSVASNKTYAMLESYLQKSKSGQLQDAIAQTIAVYKHDISTYKGAFQCLSSDVLTYDDDIEVKPLLKFFLAGCFSDCVIYQKKDSNNN